MQISVRKIVRSFDLAEYAEEYRDQHALFWVWVNPPRRLRIEYERAADEMDKLTQSLQDLVKECKAKGTVPDAAAFKDLQAALDAVAQRVYGSLSEIWSQGEDPSTHLKTEEVGELARNLIENDPPLWSFIVMQSFRMIAGHLESARKN